MYFFPHKPKPYLRAAHIRPLHRYALTLSLLIIMTYAWFVGVYQRLQRTIDRRQQEMAHIKRQQQLAERAPIISQQLKDSIATLQEQLYGADYQKGTDRLQQMMQQIFDMAQEVGLVFNACHVEKEFEQQPFVGMTVTMKMTGSYDSLLLFCNAMQQQKLLITWQRLQVTAGQKKGIYALRCVLALHTLK